MRTLFRFRTLPLVGVIAVAALIACTGDDGKDGAAGATGPAGTQGTPGPQGPSGLAGPPGIGVDGGLPTSCLSPCHGFNGTVEQWKTSTHYATAIANTGGDEVPTWTGPGACGNCHASDAIEGRVAGKVGTLGGATVTNLASGELEYKHPTTGALTESTYGGSSKVAIVGCTTCHSVTDATDPHRTGKAYADGDFPVRVPHGATDQAVIEKSPTVGVVAGTPVGTMGAANTCVWCHRSRKDVTNFINASTISVTSPYWGPHEGPQADVFSGAGGYHFATKTYGQSTHQQRLTCIDCHMPKVESNGGAPNHSFNPQLSACSGCHAGATSFDIAGGESLHRTAMTELQGALNDMGLLTRSAAAPYAVLSPTERADGHFELDKTKPGASLTADQAGALYNYLIIARGSGLGAHNPKYTRQLIYDSFVAIKGTAPASLSRP